MVCLKLRLVASYKLLLYFPFITQTQENYHHMPSESPVFMVRNNSTTMYLEMKLTSIVLDTATDEYQSVLRKVQQSIEVALLGL
jgi:hypothetical protein